MEADNEQSIGVNSSRSLSRRRVLQLLAASGDSPPWTACCRTAGSRPWPLLQRTAMSLQRLCRPAA